MRFFLRLLVRFPEDLGQRNGEQTLLQLLLQALLPVPRLLQLQLAVRRAHRLLPQLLQRLPVHQPLQPVPVRPQPVLQPHPLLPQPRLPLLHQQRDQLRLLVHQGLLVQVRRQLVQLRLVLVHQQHVRPVQVQVQQFNG